MTSLIISPSGFIFLLLLYGVGAVGSVLYRKTDAASNAWSSIFSIFGSLFGMLFSAMILISGNAVSFVIGKSSLSLVALSVHIDMLAAFFIFVISLIVFFCSVYGIGYIKHYYGKYDIGELGFFYNLFIIGMLLVVSASNGIFFLIAWEIMSIASYFLVVYDRNEENNVKAGFLYLIMTHAGTAMIILAFLLAYKFTGSWDFEAIKSGAAIIPLYARNIIFVLAMIGFGTKAGIVPFHIWLPSAHPAAPSHVSALMSGVMIKTGIYMMIRMFLDILHAPAWWGFVILILGSVSCLLGVLYALTEHDIKRLLAYHSIENIGIILLGFGSALVFSSLGMSTFAMLALVAALFHILNHAIFKSLLFLSAGSVINQTHTRNMEEYGGLIRYMPQTAFFFLVGSMAISALPPFNGFFSEWLTFQSLFQGMIAFDSSSKWIFVLAAGVLAFTGGLALACFVKAFGASFLARPRSPEVAHAKESSFSLRFAMGALATLALCLGIFSGRIVSLLTTIGDNLHAFKGALPSFSTGAGYNLSVGDGFASVSGPLLSLILMCILVAVIALVHYMVNKGQRVTIGTTWDCGTNLTPRMEITATGFARSIILIFRGILRPTVQHDIEYHDYVSRYLPKSRTITLGIHDVHHSYFYKPLRELVQRISMRVKGIQTGNVNTYMLYIFIALVVALFSILL